MRFSIYAAIALIVGGLTVGVAPLCADPVAEGTYQLSNHPEGAIAPPLYGLRLDNAFGDVGSYTFDFNYAGDAENPASDVKLEYLDSLIRISGVAFGGIDTGAGYLAGTTGTYFINFLYDTGVQLVPGDAPSTADDLQDVWVNAANNSNFGVVISPSGESQFLTDERGTFDFSFRFGDNDDGLGLRGVDDLTGWGWLAYCSGDGAEGQCGTITKPDGGLFADWLFTADFIPGDEPFDEIPEPGTWLLMASGLFVASRLRRK